MSVIESLPAARAPRLGVAVLFTASIFLSASLLFSLRKYKQQPDPISCEVSAEVGRNDDKRLRVLGMTARLTLGVPAAGIEHLQRVLDTFEDFCTVTASVRAGFPVQVTVVDSLGAKLK